MFFFACYTDPALFHIFSQLVRVSPPLLFFFFLVLGDRTDISAGLG